MKLVSWCFMQFIIGSQRSKCHHHDGGPGITTTVGRLKIIVFKATKQIQQMFLDWSSQSYAKFMSNSTQLTGDASYHDCDRLQTFFSQDLSKKSEKQLQKKRHHTHSQWNFARRFFFFTGAKGIRNSGAQSVCLLRGWAPVQFQITC